MEDENPHCVCGHTLIEHDFDSLCWYCVCEKFTKQLKEELWSGRYK